MSASQRRAAAAQEAGVFDAEIVPIDVPGRKGSVTVDRDEHLRPDATVEGMAKLKPVFKEGGTVHPGNSSGITDGSAAMLVMNERAVE